MKTHEYFTMKKLLIGIITVYQKFISLPLHQLLGISPGTGCRHTPSCSVYAQHAFEHYGIAKGLLLSSKRLLSCQPFFSL